LCKRESLLRMPWKFKSMMQETYRTGSSEESGPQVYLDARGLGALLALAGSRKLQVGALRSKMKLTPSGADALVSWLQREYLVDVVSSLDGTEVREALVLTDLGEKVLLGLLEQMCELPEPK
jgi:hypothetical protein